MIGTYRIIAMCTSRIQDRECYELITELQQQLRGTDMRLFVLNTDVKDGNGNFRSSGSTGIFDLLQHPCIDIVLVDEERIKSPVISDALIKDALAIGRPVMVIGEAHEGCVNIKFNDNGFGDVIRHMIDVHGLRKLHMMAGIKGNPFSDGRIAMFRNVLDEYGLPFDESMVSYGGFWTTPATEATEQLLQRGDLPQAILCANDSMAIAAIGTLKKHGYRVPQDIAVTGYDNEDEAYFCEPQLTTVAHGNSALCQELVKLLQSAEKGRTETVYVNTRMLTHCSCGCETSTETSAVEHIIEQGNRFFRYQDEGITLSEISAQIQLCKDFEEMCHLMHADDKMYAVACMLKKEYIDFTIDPEKQHEKGFGDELLLLFDGDCINYEKQQGRRFVPHMMKSSDILPSLQYYLDDSRCIIFNLLCYHGVPLGYLAFHYSEYGVGNFLKIPQTVTALNNALGSFRNSRYQEYLIRRIDEMYRTDALTGLLNRHGFMTEYAELLSHIGDQPLTAVLLDLDGLKQINDTFGHEEGDHAIRTAAAALRSVCPESAVCTRFGGDEMLAVFPACGYDVRESFDKELDRINSASDKPYSVMGSLGVLTLAVGEHPAFEEIVKRTDLLMYEEKRRRKAERV
ncbi:MAG: GGDEF domain-containing protein [Oscillospiraceae bacterium]|nr:GGDEF domain-containing protein [Oscillospiraceae bacterium]